MAAIGLIEISGLTASIEALDSMLKAANVEFLTYESKLGGRLVTIIVRGNVSSVQTAIETAKVKAGKVGRVAAYAVIPNPHEEIMKMIRLSAEKLSKVKSSEISKF